ncbi:MAG TPA: hypothetical protein VF257_01610 [Solirubrobacteraceae bacterium]
MPDEPSAHRIRDRAAPRLADRWTRVAAVTVRRPARPLRTVVGDDELAARRGRRRG